MAEAKSGTKGGVTVTIPAEETEAFLHFTKGSAFHDLYQQVKDLTDHADGGAPREA